jgi:peptidylprolyl isomerase
MTKLIRTLIFAVLALSISLSGRALAADLENTLYLDLPNGRVVIQLRPDLAPTHVKRIKELVRRGFYDGLAFHRVIVGFMAQTGDPLGNGTGGTGHLLKAEFSKEPFVRGAIGMAHSQDPNSGDSQFFIMTGDKPEIDGKYTIWGYVVSGMELIDHLKAGDESVDAGLVDQPDRIVQMNIAADVEKKP